jgi:hypothetical protein
MCVSRIQPWILFRNESTLKNLNKLEGGFEDWGHRVEASIRVVGRACHVFGGCHPPLDRHAVSQISSDVRNGNTIGLPSESLLESNSGVGQVHAFRPACSGMFPFGTDAGQRDHQADGTATLDAFTTWVAPTRAARAARAASGVFGKQGSGIGVTPPGRA